MDFICRAISEMQRWQAPGFPMILILQRSRDLMICTMRRESFSRLRSGRQKYYTRRRAIILSMEVQPVS